MSHSYFPKARHKDLVTTKVGDETVVYDISASKAYCLNHVTTQVWKACDGHRHVESLLNQVKQAGFPDVTEDLIKASDLLIITGTTLVNGTFDSIWNLIKDHKKSYVIYGMTAVGVAYLAGFDRICPYGHDE